MRDFASCYNEHAIKASDPSCSSNSSINSSVQISITTLYHIQLSTQKDLLIKLTWLKTHTGPTLALEINSINSSKSSINSNILRKRKGTRSYISGTSIIGLYWDYASANFFSSGLEPVSKFYVVVTVDGEFALLIGDLSSEYINRFEEIMHVAKSSMVSRREQVIGGNSCGSICSTKVRFSDEGSDHDIVIRCNELELNVSIDKKSVVVVKRLRWNFRGNQTIFIDGMPVDLMWDLSRDSKVFMFRKRSALESRLWFEEEMLNKEKGISGFSLLIQAFNNT